MINSNSGRTSWGPVDRDCGQPSYYGHECIEKDSALPLGDSPLFDLRDGFVDSDILLRKSLWGPSAPKNEINNSESRVKILQITSRTCHFSLS